MNTNDVLNKLIAEIERRIESWDIHGKNSPAGQGKDTCESRVTELSDLLSFIASLLQKQPECIYGRTPEEREKCCKFCSAICEARIEQEQPEVDLEKFTDKIKTFQERYKYPEIVSIKGAMAFMARMCITYPEVAKEWYNSLPKATMD